MDFSTIADSAITLITEAASGAGPAVISVAGLLIGVGVVISLLKRAKA